MIYCYYIRQFFDRLIQPVVRVQALVHCMKLGMVMDASNNLIFFEMITREREIGDRKRCREDEIIFKFLVVSFLR